LVPQDDVETVPALEVLDAVDDADEADVLVDAVPPPVELELELQAARTPSDSAAAAAATARVRQWTDLFMSSAFSWLTGSSLVFRTGAALRLAAQHRSRGLAERRAVHRFHK
jgi:hypothetical protein